MTSFETLIGLRYLRAKRRNSFISFISLISIVGIALGVAALIIVLSVMNGFQKEIRGRILGVASHLEISGVNNRLADWRGAMAVARQDPRVLASAPFVSAQGLLSAGANVRGVLVRGAGQDFAAAMYPIVLHPPEAGGFAHGWGGGTCHVIRDKFPGV